MSDWSTGNCLWRQSASHWSDKNT